MNLHILAQSIQMLRYQDYNVEKYFTGELRNLNLDHSGRLKFCKIENESTQLHPDHISTCLTPTFPYQYLWFPNPQSLSYLTPPLKVNRRWEERPWEDYNMVLIQYLHYNQLLTLLSSSPYIILSFSIIHHALTCSFPLSPTEAACLVWPQTNGMNMLGSWGVKEGQVWRTREEGEWR